MSVNHTFLGNFGFVAAGLLGPTRLIAGFHVAMDDVLATDGRFQLAGFALEVFCVSLELLHLLLYHLPPFFFHLISEGFESGSVRFNFFLLLLKVTQSLK